MEELKPMTPPMVTPMTAEMVTAQMEAEEKRRADRFGVLILPTVVYAVAFTFCIYDNFGGILQAVLALATVIYCRLVEKRMGIVTKPGSIVLEVMMVLLGFSTGTTGNGVIWDYNLLGLFLLTLVRLLHNAYDDEKWDLGKYLGSMLSTIGCGLEHILAPVVDAMAFSKEEKSENTKTLAAVVIGLLLAIPLLAVVVSLLASADIVFLDVLHRIFHLSLADWFLIAVTFLFGFLASYSGMAAVGAHRVKEEVKAVKQYPAIVAITTLSLVTVVYLLFSVIQIVYLFLGNMALPEDYTYAEYAREGFFQLLVVCILNVIIVLVVSKRFREHVVLKGLLLLISACTYIMGASAFLRMLMYIDAYHLTRKRILVLWALVTIGLLLVGIVIGIFRQGFPLLRYGMTVFCLCYLVLAFSHMDYFIADYNIRQMQVAGELAFEDHDPWYDEGYGTVKMHYLNSLSSDAAAAFDGIPTGLYGDYREEMVDTYEEESWRQWNLSHYLAWKRCKATDLSKQEVEQ